MKIKKINSFRSASLKIGYVSASSRSNTYNTKRRKKVTPHWNLFKWGHSFDDVN